MKTIEIGSLTTRVTGGTDHEGGGTGPLVVLLHGFGAPGDDLVSLSRAIAAPPGTRFAFPEAPIDLGPMYMGGRAWWEIDLKRYQMRMQQDRTIELTQGAPPGWKEACKGLTKFLDALPATLGSTPERTVLGGFSQGAMLSMSVALLDPRPLAALVMMSGSLIAREELLPALGSRKGLPVFMSHGHEDPILPFSITEELRNEMQKAELNVTWIPFRGGHGIPGPVLDRLSLFLNSALEK